MPDLTDAELIKHIAHVRAHNPPYKCGSALALAEYVERSIAARLERPVTDGLTMHGELRHYPTSQQGCVHVFFRDGDFERATGEVPFNNRAVRVTITPA